MRTYVRMVVCVYLPRFELVVAAGGPDALAGRALALAPLLSSEKGPAGGGRVGEVSGAAEACGVARGMALGGAPARGPELVLLSAAPVRVAESWEAAVRSLESVGAAVEAERPGLAYFETDGLRGVPGADRGGIAAARPALARPAR